MSEERARILGLLASGKITAEEAERLLDALAKGNGGRAEVMEAGPRNGPKGKLKFLRVTVDSQSGDKVNVRVPLDLVRAGIKLKSLIPPSAMDKIGSQMREHGFQLDLNSLKQEDVEKLIDSLGEMEVNVDSKNGDTVRVFCE
jgi:hypothetical protein